MLPLTADISGQVSREIVAAAPDGIVLVAGDGTIRFANPEAARIFGYPRQALLGLAVESLVPSELRARHERHRGDFAASARKRPMGSGLDLHAQRRDGTRVPVEISLSPIESSEGAFVVVIVRDVTDRRAAEATIQELSESLAARVQHLEALNAELESFSYSVSHDLRAPLRAIDGFSLALLEDFGAELSPQARHFLDRIRAGAQRMAQLIDDLLQLSRVARADLQRERVDVSDLAATVMRDLARQEPGRRYTVEIEPELQLAADANLMRVVLENLLGNAWKFTGEEPLTVIRITGTRLDGEPAVVIDDNGAGFDEQYASKMFGAFQRLHTDDQFTGTGVGLAIVQRILLRHGGRITASGQPGAGARFVFRTTSSAEPGTAGTVLPPAQPAASTPPEVSP